MIKYKSSHFCRVCGLDQHEDPWEEDGKSPTYGICFCCGTEFGYDDCWIVAIRAARKKWLDNGARWSEEKYKPLNWSLEDQIKNTPKEYL